jgi:5-methylthioribose kinase
LTLRERFERIHPGRYFLDADDRDGLQSWLSERRWIDTGEHVVDSERAGEGNMNLTLRVRTGVRTFIVKQARPWVEKYPTIDAPDERAVVEGSFYEAVASARDVAGLMPKLLAVDKNSRVLMLEDLGPAQDCTDLYSGGELAVSDCHALIAYLGALHDRFRDPKLRPVFANRAMRALNYEHVFSLPLRSNNGLDLDKITPGLDHAASKLKNDTAYCRRATEIGELYLSDGVCLVHGDFFPGSWIRTPAGLRVIDPEFCFFGVPEFDFGVFLAHMYLAKQRDEIIDVVREKAAAEVLAFAGVEIMRRLIGVAQLPVRYGIEEKHRLLDLSRKLVLQ